MTGSPNTLAAHILSREEALLDPAMRQSPERIESLVSGDFFEFGSSGRIYRYHRGDTFPPVTGYTITDFSVTELSPGCVLAAYQIRLDTGQGVKTSLRSTLWRHTEDGWKAVFHQGTPV